MANLLQQGSDGRLLVDSADIRAIVKDGASLTRFEIIPGANDTISLRITDSNGKQYYTNAQSLPKGPKGDKGDSIKGDKGDSGGVYPYQSNAYTTSLITCRSYPGAVPLFEVRKRGDGFWNIVNFTNGYIDISYVAASASGSSAPYCSRLNLAPKASGYLSWDRVVLGSICADGKLCHIIYLNRNQDANIATSDNRLELK